MTPVKLPQNVTIRRVPDTPTDADFAAAKAIGDAIYPDQKRTLEEMKESHSRRNPEHFNVRFLAERDGVPVGKAGAGHSPWNYDPHKFWTGVDVIPDARDLDIGSALYAHVLDAVRPLKPKKLTAHTRSDWPDAMHFAAKHGFVEEMREFESRLDVAAFDPAPFAQRRDLPARHGIEILMLSELQAEADWTHRLYELEKDTSVDVPNTEPFSFPSEEEYVRLALNRSGFLPEGYAIARDTETGEWVGSSALSTRKADDWLETGLTAVKRSYRRKGIALALKLYVIDYAKSVGCPVITTENATTNRAMLSINEALGFIKQPAWVMLAYFPEGKSTVTGDPSA